MKIRSMLIGIILLILILPGCIYMGRELVMTRSGPKFVLVAPKCLLCGYPVAAFTLMTAYNCVFVTPKTHYVLRREIPLSHELIVGENDKGWKVRKTKTEDDVVYFDMWDPVLEKWYPAILVDKDTVVMSDNSLVLWKKHRMALPKERRFEALQVKPEVESDEEIDYGAGCFDSGTRVLMADGGLRDISSIKGGEMVRSYNIEKGLVEDKKVTKTYIFPTKGYYLINGELKATAKHKFLMAGGGNTWKKASELQPGDKVQSINGQITITSVEELEEKETAHNFQVADTKAYIVTGGENFYVVHNGL
ncbi:polymorphic toxin-type HINT domain-containing protein [Thermodesulfobacteriota bacterium]